MYSLVRILSKFFASGKPLNQVLIGIGLIPLGGFISWAALFADPNHYYPYFAILGVVLSIFGLALLIKGIIGLVTKKPVQQPVGAQATYATPGQPVGQPGFAQQPYGQPSYPPQPQAYAAPAQPVGQPGFAQQPYGQPPYPPQPQTYAAPAQPVGQPVFAQQPYGQPSYPPQPQASEQAQYPQSPYEQ